jgi:hypothetical protein
MSNWMRRKHATAVDFEATQRGAENGALFTASAAPANLKGSRMRKRRNDANNIFRPSDRPLTEYEEEQKALRKNLERLKTERLAREGPKPKDA